MSAGVWVPPGGFVSASQQTPAAQVEMGLRGRTSGSTRRRKAKRKKAAKRAKTAKKRKSGRKLKFGSPAWRKKYMKKRK